MTIPQIELWAIEVADRVKTGQHVEDTRVELKADWPSDHRDVARRIAGQANAARGEPIIYIVGLDEKRGVTGADTTNLAAWFDQVTKHFESVAPTMRDHAFTLDGKAVVAMQFDTDAAPFVVKTGIPGAVTHEVPWRAATGIRSAQRGDLIRMLVPMQRLPHLDFIKGGLSVKRGRGVGNSQTPIRWQGAFDVYVTPRTRDHLAFPHHRCRLRISAQGNTEDFPVTPRAQSTTVVESGSEVLMNGPGLIRLVLDIHTAQWMIQPISNVSVEIVLGIAGEEQAVIVQLEMPVEPSSTTDAGSWASQRSLWLRDNPVIGHVTSVKA